MLTHIRRIVFSLYERPVIRNWFYTVAFAIFVPVGWRFATLAWRYGGDVDRMLTFIGGMTVGITAVVTLLRIWTVAPRKTVVEDKATETPGVSAHVSPSTSEMLAAARESSARNRQIALGARALGSPRHPAL